MFSAADALRMVEEFEAGEDAKSQELIVGLLLNTDAPFSREQFTPGHITCTAAILHPEGGRVLLMHHHRLQRWLLPGGHVEPEDMTLAASAHREAVEETEVPLAGVETAVLVGVDVHGIPAKRGEPYHLHHDLIFALRAVGDRVVATAEAPQVVWCELERLGEYRVAPNIVRAAKRAAG